MLPHKLGFVLFQLNLFLTDQKDISVFLTSKSYQQGVLPQWLDIVKYWAESKQNKEMLHLVSIYYAEIPSIIS